LSNVFLHLHPAKVNRDAVAYNFTWGMGGMTFYVYITLVFTGTLLMFYYHPSKVVAFRDILYLESDVPFGKLLRNMHRWAAHLMVITTWLHMFRVVLTGSYKKPREFNWCVGVVLLVLTLLLSFTGYLLPDDQLGFWAVTVGTNMARATPMLGHEGPFGPQLGLTAYTGTTSGTKSAGADSTTRSSLQSDFNNVLDQIDALAKDASYNGINLLNGDDLKVTFNEKGTSSLTIKGVNFQSTSLGLNKLNGKQFQDNIQIDSTISSIDISLTSLPTQSSKFGANLTTVQTRQDFTKNMINTLQTGSDNLVLADTNEEGANMLALQTRQQLSTTALSLANQASQAVLRLF